MGPIPAGSHPQAAAAHQQRYGRKRLGFGQHLLVGVVLGSRAVTTVQKRRSVQRRSNRHSLRQGAPEKVGRGGRAEKTVPAILRGELVKGGKEFRFRFEEIAFGVG